MKKVMYYLLSDWFNDIIDCVADGFFVIFFCPIAIRYADTAHYADWYVEILVYVATLPIVIYNVLHIYHRHKEGIYD